MNAFFFVSGRAADPNNTPLQLDIHWSHAAVKRQIKRGGLLPNGTPVRMSTDLSWKANVQAKYVVT